MSIPEKIWARVSPDWHCGETGEEFVGGMFDAGHFCDGEEYIHSPIYKDLTEKYNELLNQHDSANHSIHVLEERVYKLLNERIDLIYAANMARLAFSGDVSSRLAIDALDKVLGDIHDKKNM